jgi:hypothetical protein
LVQRNNTCRASTAVGDGGKFCFHDVAAGGILTRRVPEAMRDVITNRTLAPGEAVDVHANS